MIRSRRRPSEGGPALAVLLAALLAGCGGGDEAVDNPAPAPDPLHPAKLSTLGYFEAPMAELRPAPGVVPYTVASALWADHASKSRFLVLPEGGRAEIGDDGEWSLPEGTVIIKTFAFPADLREPEGATRIIETRLLINEPGGWTGQAYVWNEEQTEAFREVAGVRTEVATVDLGGKPETHEYVVPNVNQCGNCHARDDLEHPLGVITAQLNRDVERDGATVNQIAWLATQGVIAEPPPDPKTLPALPDPFGDGPVDLRARAYLHANCAHCHRPGGGGGNTGLVLLYDEAEPRKLGVCKTPISAGSGTGGHPYDVVPGQPDESILPFRMGSTDPEIKMPELPNRLPDDEGIALIKAWIGAMTPAGCPE